MVGVVTEFINICIEQVIGTFIQGCTKAICAWGPHCAETFCTPLVGENLEKLLVSLVGENLEKLLVSNTYK